MSMPNEIHSRNAKHVIDIVSFSVLHRHTHPSSQPHGSLNPLKSSQLKFAASKTYKELSIQEMDFGPQIEWKICKVQATVRDQLTAPTCWAFACLASIEVLLKLVYDREQPMFSAQELIDHIEPPDPKLVDPKTKCFPYKTRLTFKWILKHGIIPESDYPYTGARGVWRQRMHPERAIKIKGYSFIKKGDEDGIISRLAHQPVVSGLEIDKAFKNLKKEIYMGCQGQKDPPVVHAVLIVGYGTDKRSGLNYWIIQNSYGTDWGVNGYGRVIRNSSSPDNHQWTRKAFFPIIKA